MKLIFAMLIVLEALSLWFGIRAYKKEGRMFKNIVNPALMIVFCTACLFFVNL